MNNDYEPDGEGLAIQTVTNAQTANNGRLTINVDGTYTYTPANGFVGTDFYQYTVCENKANPKCAVALLEILVSPTNDPPVAPSDNAITPENTVVAGNVKTNDSDPNVGQTISVTAVTNVATKNGGKISIDAAGAFTYTPSPNYNGIDEYVYTLCDNGSPVLCVQGTLFITITTVNNLPLAVNDRNKTNTNETLTVTNPSQGVLQNDFDADNTLVANVVTNVATVKGGKITINANGTYIYTPPYGFVGTGAAADSYFYTACESVGGTPQCVSVILFIDVLPIVYPPFAAPDQIVTTKNIPITGTTVLANDFDPIGSPLTINVNPLSPPKNGTVVINPDGTYLYTP
ncbi:MAG: tandem-95 repeat protein, partial [Bacteroidetes bacterium]